MTAPADEITGVDSDRVDGRPIWGRALAVLAVGLIVGALLGALVGSSAAASYQASTALSVLPDPTLSTSNQDNSNAVSQDATAFIQSELVVLNSSVLADSVQAKLRLSVAPDVTSTQVGQSYVVRVTATAPTRSRAVAIARATASAYSAERSRELTTEIKSLQASVTSQLNTVRTSLNQTRSGQRSTTALTPSQTALQTEYERLLSVRSDLSNTQATIATVVRVLTPARADSSAVSTTTKDALAGAVAGALIALALLTLLRRSRPRVRSVSDLVTLNVPTLLPVLPTPSVRRARAGKSWQLPESRLLAARLQSDIRSAGSLLVVVGTDAASGARGVAGALAAQLAGRRPVLLVSDAVEVPGVRRRAGAHSSTETQAKGSDPAPDASAPEETAPEEISPDESELAALGWGAMVSDGLWSDVTRSDAARLAAANHESDTAHPGAAPSVAAGVWLLPARVGDGGDTGDGRLDPHLGRLVDVLHTAVASGWLVVLDAPPLAESGLAVDCAEQGGLLALVVGRDRATPAEVLGAIDLFDARGVRFGGAVLTSAPGAVARRLRRLVRGSITLPRPVPGTLRSVAEPPWAPADDEVATSVSQHGSTPSRNGASAVRYPVNR